MRSMRSMGGMRSMEEVDEEELMNVALVQCSAGACLRGHLKTSGRAVTLKLLDTDSRLSQMQDALVQGGVCVKRVLLPVGVYRSRFLTALLWDWMPEGSLHSLLYTTVLYPELPLALRLRILLDVAEGLDSLHVLSLPHTALKTTNVLLDHQYRAKLCDWGCETLVDVRTRAPCFRDLVFLAPEVLLGNIPDVRSDVYSFGVLMWETLNRRPPNEGFDQLQNLVQEGAEHSLARKLLPLDTPQSHALIQLMTRCWSGDPKQRPLAEECVVELRKVLETLEPGAECRAVHLIQTCKERALLSCKHTATWALPIELNNLEGYGGCTGQKYLKSKTMAVTVPFSHKHGAVTRGSDGSSPRGSPPSPTPARASPPTRCCRGLSSPGRVPPPPNTPCGSPTSPTHTPLHPANQSVCPVSFGRTCCRLLLERREAIVQFMTEGRLNNLLDVLRARRVVTREDYEFITAALTLSARTRCLLDTCACLGEKVAVLVATTLGLVSLETAQGHARSRISPKGQAG